MTCSHQTSHTHLLIIGAGPAGYAAAFRAADLGLSVTIVDMQRHPGGVCLNCGCIPSKALLHAAKILTDSKDAKAIGIDLGSPQLDLEKLQAWKNSVIQRLATGLLSLFKQRKITLINGRATFLNATSIQTDSLESCPQTITFDHCLIATGSRPINLPFAPLSTRVMNSTLALDLDDIPKRLLVIGGGYIGLELGTAYAALGSEVSVCEMTPAILPGADRDLVTVLERRLKKTFKSLLLNTKVLKLEETADAISVTFEGNAGAQSQSEYDKVLIAIGRKPFTQDLGLDRAGVKVDDKGFIKTNDQRQTENPKIYAAGDVAGGIMLAHKASHEGTAVAEVIAGKDSALFPEVIPAVVFSDPEIAWVGLTESEAKTQNREFRIVKMPWSASGRAVTLDRTDGLTKIIVDPKTETILGIGIVGVSAGELISEAVLAIQKGLKISELKNLVHPHPTLCETLMETAGLFDR